MLGWPWSRTLGFALLALTSACGDEPPHEHPDDAQGPFAVEIVDVDFGEGAGFGQDRLPDVVLGPPVAPESSRSGSLDVLSLGAGGSIVLRMGTPVVDEDGVDLLVFENVFQFQNADGTFDVNAEPGEVSVSEDGEAFVTFACDPAGAPPNGCAGYALTLGGEPTVPETAGGDGFDLADVGLATATFVRIVDRGPQSGVGTSAGFDLDAVAAVH